MSAKTPEFFGRSVDTSDEQMEEAVRRQRQKKEAPNVVVGTKTYDQAMSVIEGLKKIGIESGITEGGVMLHMNGKKEVRKADKYLRGLGLSMNLGITPKEDGRNVIGKMHEADRQINNSLDN